MSAPSSKQPAGAEVKDVGAAAPASEGGIVFHSGASEPRVLIATREGVSRCAQCRAYRRATLEGLNFSVYWCGRCPSRLVLTRFDGADRPNGSSTHVATRHVRDERIHLFETDAGPLVIFLRPADPYG